MPTYEYACEKCEHQFEAEQRITADPIKTCPACRSRRVKRLISQTSFVLKGSGWYSDLYSSPGAKDKKSDEKSSPSTSDSSTSDSSKKSGTADTSKSPNKPKSAKAVA